MTSRTIAPLATVGGVRTGFFDPDSDRFYRAVRTTGTNPALIGVAADFVEPIGIGGSRMKITKLMIAGLWAVGIVAAAVLLFLAGDHDDEIHDQASAKPALHSAH